MNVKVIGSHVHVADGDERCAHVYADHTALVPVIVLVVVAHVADVGGSPRSSLQILNTLAKLARVRRLLLRLSLMRQVRLIVVVRCQLALRRNPIFVNINTRIHLLRLLGCDCSALRGTCLIAVGIASHLVPLALARALYSISL